MASTVHSSFSGARARTSADAKALFDGLVSGSGSGLATVARVLRETATDINETIFFWGAKAHPTQGLPATTCLHVAAYKGCAESIRWLLERGADAAAVDGVGRSVEDVAAGDDVVALLRRLVEEQHQHGFRAAGRRPSMRSTGSAGADAQLVQGDAAFAFADLRGGSRAGGGRRASGGSGGSDAGEEPAGRGGTGEGGGREADGGGAGQRCAAEGRDGSASTPAIGSASVDASGAHESPEAIAGEIRVTDPGSAGSGGPEALNSAEQRASTFAPGPLRVDFLGRLVRDQRRTSEDRGFGFAPNEAPAAANATAASASPAVVAMTPITAAATEADAHIVERERLFAQRDAAIANVRQLTALVAKCAESIESAEAEAEAERRAGERRVARAREQVANITKRQLNEVMSLRAPPPVVQQTIEAVGRILLCSPSFLATPATGDGTNDDSDGAAPLSASVNKARTTATSYNALRNMLEHATAATPADAQAGQPGQHRRVRRGSRQESDAPAAGLLRAVKSSPALQVPEGGRLPPRARLRRAATRAAMVRRTEQQRPASRGNLTLASGRKLTRWEAMRHVARATDMIDSILSFNPIWLTAVSSAKFSDVQRATVDLSVDAAQYASKAAGPLCSWAKSLLSFAQTMRAQTEADHDAGGAGGDGAPASPMTRKRALGETLARTKRELAEAQAGLDRVVAQIAERTPHWRAALQAFQGMDTTPQARAVKKAGGFDAWATEELLALDEPGEPADASEDNAETAPDPADPVEDTDEREVDRSPHPPSPPVADAAPPTSPAAPGSPTVDEQLSEQALSDTAETGRGPETLGTEDALHSPIPPAVSRTDSDGVVGTPVGAPPLPEPARTPTQARRATESARLTPSDGSARSSSSGPAPGKSLPTEDTEGTVSFRNRRQRPKKSAQRQVGGQQQQQRPRPQQRVPLGKLSQRTRSAADAMSADKKPINPVPEKVSRFNRGRRASSARRMSADVLARIAAEMGTSGAAVPRRAGNPVNASGSEDDAGLVGVSASAAMLGISFGIGDSDDDAVVGRVRATGR